MIRRDQLDRLGQSLAVVAALLRIAEIERSTPVGWMDLVKSGSLLWRRPTSMSGLLRTRASPFKSMLPMRREFMAAVT
jgi:hypothetical protein